MSGLRREDFYSEKDYLRAEIERLRETWAPPGQILALAGEIERLRDTRDKLADFIEAHIPGSEVLRDSGTVVT